jgi:Fe-S-cluster containining protein
VDDAIFTRRYFGYCLRCSFCGDACCTHGVDVSIVERDRILARADELAPLVAGFLDEPGTG